MLGLGLGIDRGFVGGGGAAAASFLLDETYASGAVRAYSTRRLYSLYTGACMRVRRDSDDTEQDIGFDANGNLDTSALATFVGSGNNGYVSHWYGQESSGDTGSGVDATQSTNANQPKIYDATDGVLANTDGVPFLTFRDTWGVGSPHLGITTSLSPRSVFAAFGAGGSSSANTQMTVIGPENGIVEYLTAIQAGRIKYHGNVVIPGGQSDPLDDRIVALSSDGVTALNHSNTITSTTVPSSFISDGTIFGRLSSNNRQMERAYELVIYTTAKSTTDHNSIREQMNNHYEFYT